MTCGEARTRWLQARDEGIADQEASDHVARCAECREYAAQIDRLLAGLAVLRDATTTSPPHTRRLIAHRAHRRVAPPRRVGWLLRIAAAIVLVGAATRYLDRTEPRLSVAPIRKAGLVPTLGTESARSASIRLEGASVGQYLPVVRTASDANVDVIWLYPVHRSSASVEKARS